MINQGSFIMKTSTRVITAHVPVQMAIRLEQLTEQLDRSRGWIIKQALDAWIAQQERYHQLTLEALTDVDARNLISQRAVLAWADSLSTDKPLPVPHE